MQLRAEARSQKLKKAEQPYANLEVGLWAGLSPYTEAPMQAWATWRNHTSWRVWKKHENTNTAEEPDTEEGAGTTNTTTVKESSEIATSPPGEIKDSVKTKDQEATAKQIQDEETVEEEPQNAEMALISRQASERSCDHQSEDDNMAAAKSSLGQDLTSKIQKHEPEEHTTISEGPVPADEQTNGDNQEDSQASTLGLATDAQTMNALKEATEATAHMAQRIKRAEEELLNVQEEIEAAKMAAKAQYAEAEATKLRTALMEQDVKERQNDLEEINNRIATNPGSIATNPTCEPPQIKKKQAATTGTPKTKPEKTKTKGVPDRPKVEGHHTRSAKRPAKEPTPKPQETDENESESDSSSTSSSSESSQTANPQHNIWEHAATALLNKKNNKQDNKEEVRTNQNNNKAKKVP